MLVVEGAQYSGSAITARLALDQDREVYAVPGNITSRESWGPNLLIKQGAKLVQEWTDIVDDFKPEDRRRLLAEGGQLQLDSTEGTVKPITLPSGPTGDVCRGLLSMLKVEEGRQLDSLVESSCGYSSSEIIAALFELELLGLVRQLPGKQYVKVWADPPR